jgi:hypothetical protein
MLASGGNDNKLLVWDLKKHSQPQWNFGDHNAAVKVSVNFLFNHHVFDLRRDSDLTRCSLSISPSLHPLSFLFLGYRVVSSSAWTVSQRRWNC